MTYIKLESAKNKIIEIKTRIFDDLDQHNWLEIAEIIFNEINSLPSINPEAMIEDMIKEKDELYFNHEYTDWLRELLQKFKS